MTTTTNQPTQAQWDAANRFLDQLFIDPILANGYQQISQQANGQDNAPEILTTWLQQQGYDTTPELVYSALIALQNTSLAYWMGIYGQSFLGSSEPAPVLAIGPDAEGNTVAYLDGVELKNFVFQSVEIDNVFHPTLSWDLESNQTAGNITFYYTSAVTLDPDPPTGYTGNWFEGTLQTSVSSSFQRYYGAIGKPADPSVMSQLILASGKEQSWWDKYSTDVYIGIGTLGFIVAVVCIGVLVYRRYRVPERDFEEVRQDNERLTAEEWTEKIKQQHFDDFQDPYSVLSRTAKKVIATCKSEKISERQFLDAFNLAGQSIDPYEFTAEEFNQMFERKALATLKEEEINQYHQSTESKARQAIAEELGDKTISYEQFNQAVEAKMQELGANEKAKKNLEDILDQQGDLFLKLANKTITPDEMSDLKLLSKVGDRREGMETKIKTRQKIDATKSPITLRAEEEKFDKFCDEQIQGHSPSISDGEFPEFKQQEQKIIDQRALSPQKYHDEISGFKGNELQNFLAKVKLANQFYKDNLPNPPSEFQPLKKEPISQKEITKHIKEQKNLFSNLKQTDPKVLTSLQKEYSKEEIDIPLAINNIYQDPKFIDQWEELIQEGKENHYFDTSLQKKWDAQSSNLKKHSEGAEGHWIDSQWYSQDLINWKNNRDQWLDNVGKILSESHPANGKQLKPTDPTSKVVEPHKPTGSSKETPGETKKVTPDSSSNKVVSNNPTQSKLDDKTFTSPTQKSDNPDERQDSKKDHLKESDKKSEHSERREYKK